MLFYLEFSRELTELPTRELSDPISALINAHRAGIHFVVIDRRSAEWLSERVDLSERDKAMLDRIAQGFTQAGGLRKRARTYVQLSADQAKHLTRDGSVITVALQRLGAFRVLERSILLVENAENDGNVYEFLLRNHSDLHGVSHVEFDVHHGGGEELLREFGRLMRSHRMVCALVDSDSDSPLSQNSKLKGLLRVKERASWPFGFALSPPCREAENLLPMEIVMGLPCGYGNRSNQVLLDIARAEMAEGNEPSHRYWLFFDAKIGLTAEKFEKLSVKDQAWISAKLRLVNIGPERDIQGYGEKIITQVFSDNRTQSVLRAKTRQSDWRGLFDTFLDEVLWLMLAARKVVT